MQATVIWHQHPVGHGGLHTGHAEVDGHALRWMFDCGGQAGARFDGYLRNWMRNDDLAGPLDWLFVSHFDTDHVSGLDTLLYNLPVRDVMLPYVEDHELVVTLLEAATRGRLNGTVVSMAADPGGFLRDRGVGGVTWVMPQSGVPDELFAAPPLDGGPSSAGGWKRSVKPATVAGDGTLARPDGDGGQFMPARMISGDTLTVERPGFAILFVPYRAPIDPAARHYLMADLADILGEGPEASFGAEPGIGDLARRIAMHAKTPTGRRNINAIYARHVGSANRSSMSMLSVPRVENASAMRFGRFGDNCRHHAWPESESAGLPPAWINTGDAELLRPVDLAEWAAAYSRYLPQVSVLALPHHGSDRNSDHALQGLCPADTVFTAHVRHDARRHPGPNVSAAATYRLRRVTDEGRHGYGITFQAT